MRVDGHDITAEFDGQILTLRATDSRSRATLFGPKSIATRRDELADVFHLDDALRVSADGDEIAIAVNSISKITLTKASARVGGKLTVHAADGRAFVVPFRRKQNLGFVELAESLSQSGNTSFA